MQTNKVTMVTFTTKFLGEKELIFYNLILQTLRANPCPVKHALNNNY